MATDLDSVINDLLELQKDLKILHDNDKLSIDEPVYATAQELIATAEFGMRALRNRMLQDQVKRRGMQ